MQLRARRGRCYGVCPSRWHNAVFLAIVRVVVRVWRSRDPGICADGSSYQIKWAVPLRQLHDRNAATTRAEAGQARSKM